MTSRAAKARVNGTHGLIRNGSIKFMFFCAAMTSAQQADALRLSMNEFQVNLAAVGLAMMDYHSRHGVFPASFKKLGQSMLCGSETHAIEVRPGANAGAIWHPQQCEFTYRIVTFDPIEFRVDALNSEGRVVDTLQQRWSDLPAL